MPGTITNAPKTIIKDYETYPIHLGFINGEGADLKEGQEVVLSDDFTVEKRDAANKTKVAIGTVMVGGADGERVTLRVNMIHTLKAVAKGGAFTAGDLVVPNGTVDSEGRPEYVASAAGELVTAIVLDGAAENGECIIGVLRNPVRAGTYKNTALTAADGGTVDATWDATEAAVLNNVVTRQAEIEAALQAAGIIL